MLKKIKALAVTLMVGGLLTCVGLSINNASMRVDADAPVTKTFYLDPRAEISSGFHWSDANAKFGVYLYGGASAGDFVNSFMSNSTSLPGCYELGGINLGDRTHVIFVRFSSSAETPHWDYKWNQTGNLPLSDALDLYKLTGESGGTGIGEWHNVSELSAETVSYRVNVSEETLGDTSLKAYPEIDGYVKGVESVAFEKESGNSYVVSLSKTYERAKFGNSDKSRLTTTLDLAMAKAMDSSLNFAYDITSFETNLNGSWRVITNPTFTSDSIRIWLNRNAHYESGYTYSVHYWNEAGTIDREFPILGYIDFSASKDWSYCLCYTDVKADVIGAKFQFKVYDASGRCVKGSPDTNTYASGDCLKIYKIEMSGEDMNYSKVNVAYNEDKINVDALSYVFGAFMSCSSNVDNGFGQFNTFVETWIKNNDTWYTQGNLSDVIITDYDNGYTSYETKEGHFSNEVDLYSKFLEMQSKYSATQNGNTFFSLLSLGNNEQTQSVIIITIVVVVACTAIFAFVIFSRKNKYSK